MPRFRAWSPNASRAGFFSRFMSMVAARSRVTVFLRGFQLRHAKVIPSFSRADHMNRLRLPSMASARSAGASASEESQLKRKYAPE